MKEIIRALSKDDHDKGCALVALCCYSSADSGRKGLQKKVTVNPMYTENYDNKDIICTYYKRKDLKEKGWHGELVDYKSDAVFEVTGKTLKEVRFQINRVIRNRYKAEEKVNSVDSLPIKNETTYSDSELLPVAHAVDVISKDLRSKSTQAESMTMKGTFIQAESYKWEYRGKNIEKAFIKYSFTELKYKVLVAGDFRRSDAEQDFDNLNDAQEYVLDMYYRNFPTLRRERELVKETREALSDVLACKVYVTHRGLITFRARGARDCANINELFYYGGSWRSLIVNEIYKRLRPKILHADKRHRAPAEL